MWKHKKRKFKIILGLSVPFLAISSASLIWISINQSTKNKINLYHNKLTNLDSMSKRVIQLILKNEAMSFVSDIKHKSYSAENLTKLEMLTQKVLKQIQEEDNKIKNDIKNYTQGEEKTDCLKN